MTRYLMNAAVIPHGCTGTFTYRLATVEDLVTFLQGGPVLNTIVYPDTLTWVHQLTGQRFKAARDTDQAQTLLPGDEAFVIRRVSRRAQDWKAPFDPAVIELGLLRCEVPPAPPPPKRATRRRQKNPETASPAIDPHDPRRADKWGYTDEEVRVVFPHLQQGDQDRVDDEQPAPG